MRTEHLQFENTAAGLAALGRWASGRHSVVVFEASGAYHRDLEQMLTRRGLTFAQVNPRQARRFAEAMGRLTKTDRLDAEMLQRSAKNLNHSFWANAVQRIVVSSARPFFDVSGKRPDAVARMGSALQLKASETHSEALAGRRELLVFRRGLIKDRTAAKTRLKTARQPMLRRLLPQRLGQIKRQLARVDTAMKAIVTSDPDRTNRFEILVSIPGISTTSATALLADMPELGALNGQQAAALAGLAPISRQSGQWQGRERMQGGRHAVRQALFMPALCAIQHNHAVRAKFEELVRAGKPRKVAVTAVIRKLIALANALIRDSRKWAQDPT